MDIHLKTINNGENCILKDIEVEDIKDIEENVEIINDFNNNKLDDLKNTLDTFLLTYKESYFNFNKLENINEKLYTFLTENYSELDYSKLEDLKIKLEAFLSAHKDCRKINYRYDKILKISTLILTCATSYLLGTESEYHNLEMYFAFGSAVTSGLNNYFDNATIAEKHTGIIVMYTELINNIDKLLNNLKTQEDIDIYFCKYHDVYTNINNKTVEIGIFEYIRKRYGIV